MLRSRLYYCNILYSCTVVNHYGRYRTCCYDIRNQYTYYSIMPSLIMLFILLSSEFRIFVKSEQV